MTLPIWNVRRLAGGRLGITCPRRDCAGRAIVRARAWRARPETARVCTHCFRAARIPTTERGQ